MRQAALIIIVATFLALPAVASDTESQNLDRKDTKSIVRLEEPARPAPTIGQVRIRTDNQQHGASAPAIRFGHRCPCGYWLGQYPYDSCPCCGLPIDRDPFRLSTRRN
jgi:hypothetical protein